MQALKSARQAMVSVLRVLFVLLGAGLLPCWLVAGPARAQQPGYGQTINSAAGSGNGAAALGGVSEGKSSSVLDAVNPIDLMNRIRKNQSLDDATPPGDAVDQALRDYHGQMKASPAATVKAP